MNRHPLDPPAQLRAAARAGMLAAQGLVEGPPLLAAIRAEARRAAPAADPVGLAVRLAHRYADAHAATIRARIATRGRILAAIAPLLDRRAPSAALAEAADAEDPHGALMPEERRALVEDAILRRLRHARFAQSRLAHSRLARR